MKQIALDELFAIAKEALENPTEESCRDASIALANASHAFAFISGYVAAMREAREAVSDVICKRPVDDKP